MFTIGQAVAAKNIKQAYGRISNTRKVMEIAAITTHHTGATGYKLRRPGSKSKGGQIIWTADALEAV